mgnify:CR=1 FL=1
MPESKKYKAAVALFDREQQYTPTEAVSIVKKTASKKFDESVDIAVRLGVDPRKADQAVRGTVALPAGSGKTLRIAVIAAGDAANDARAAGADLVGADDLAQQIDGGMMDFDLLIATPDMMPLIGRLGRVLGPRGLMPNPKSGTVSDNLPKTIKEVKAGRVEFKMDKACNIGVGIGKREFLETEHGAEALEVMRAVKQALDPRGVLNPGKMFLN